jgi:hypothetical protein
MQRVIEVSTDELDVADKAFAGNRLLSAFAPAARALIEPYAEMVELEVGDTVLRRGEHVTASVFPVAQTMISLCVDIGDRRSMRSRRSGAKAQWAESSAAAMHRPSRKRRCWWRAPRTRSR